MAVNRFPYQDDILRRLVSGPATAADVSNAIANEGRAAGQGENSPELHRDVAENIDHLVHLGLAEYVADAVPKSAQLTQAGKDAATSLP
jgi:hypothetical protein